MRTNSSPISAFTQHWALLRELVKRDIQGRYKGSSFGIVWSLITPFLMLMVYTFAFGIVMKGTWPQSGPEKSSFAIILFAGLIIYGFFAECVNRAPTLITDNANYVKKVIFPLEILPWQLLLSAFFHMVMNLIVFTVLHLLMDGKVSAYSPLIFIVILPLIPLTIGLVWLLSALGVYLKDMAQVIGLATTAILFLSTVLIPPSAIPPAFKAIVSLNPISPIVNEARKVLIWEQLPDWSVLGIYTVVALIVAAVGYYFFQKTREGFADVI